MEIKDIIRNRRLELGLTMKELAARVGVSEGTISRWESGGIANMKRDKVALLSQVLGIPIDQLMGCVYFRVNLFRFPQQKKRRYKPPLISCSVRQSMTPALLSHQPLSY